MSVHTTPATGSIYAWALSVGGVSPPLTVYVVVAASAITFFNW